MSIKEEASLTFTRKENKTKKYKEHTLFPTLLVNERKYFMPTTNSKEKQ